MEENKLALIQTEVEKFFKELNFLVEVKVTEDLELDLLNVQVESEEAASLIGYHGENLQAIQTILSFLVHKALGEWVRVNVNIGDYRQKREEQLQKLALNLAMKAKFSGETQTIPNLSSTERRIVHMELAQREDILTESIGQGEDRRVVIKPK